MADRGITTGVIPGGPAPDYDDSEPPTTIGEAIHRGIVAGNRDWAAQRHQERRRG